MLAGLVVVGAVAVVALWEYFCLTMVAGAERVRFLPRWLWTVLCLAQIPLGGILFLLIGRPWQQPAARPAGPS